MAIHKLKIYSKPIFYATATRNIAVEMYEETMNGFVANKSKKKKKA